MDKIIQGVPIYPGLVRGKVKKLDTEKSFKRPGKNEILVMKNLTPDITPLILGAGAIVIEMGGMLTHGAIVARELKIPCVSGIVNATSLLLDGQIIEVDGQKGTVRY